MSAAFVIAGAGSGSGKTTLTVGLLEALRLMGVKVQPFKAGPDYIDPRLHAAVLDRPSYNLDTWMMGPAASAASFVRASAGAAVSVVEGVMGLFDGMDGTSEEGSTAHLAKVLGLPVLLVVNASRAGRSAAALVKGFKEFDPAVDVRWVVFNMVGSASHAALLEEAAKKVPGVRCLGSILRDKPLVFPERHLGLTLADDRPAAWRRFKAAAASAVRSSVDVERLLAEAARPVVRKGRPLAPGPHVGPGACRVAVARDRAFSFYYEENLDILRGLGAEVVPFSPLRDRRLPEAVGGLYIGGGYPELFIDELHENRPMRLAVRRAALSGMPVYAECGGLMYLGRSIAAPSGDKRPMAGLFPFSFRMGARRRSLGYRVATALAGCPFLERGGAVRGHEFHYSEMTGAGASARKVMAVSSPSGRRAPAESAGYLAGSALAGYCHLHFASNPDFAKGFVKRASEYSTRSRP